MSELSAVLGEADRRIDASLERLFDLMRIQSISTDPAYAEECDRAGQWLVDELSGLGFEASLRRTTGHPIVVAHHPGAGADAPHVLFYGHYDVQPVDPIGQWETPPFEPSLKTVAPGRKVITGRGSADDKGQLMTFVEACRAYKAASGELPCRVTILFEGEEESGSPSLVPFLKANSDELRAEFALVCDTNMWDADTPAISAGLHDEAGRVTLEGFYDGVEETPKEVLAMWDSLGRTAGDFLGEVGLSIPSGEKDRSVLELTWARPTAEVNGVAGGYAGEGFKTVIAAQASAKVSFRLVGKQDPAAIRASFRRYVQSLVPADCSVSFKAHGGSPAIQLPYDSALLGKARAALSEEWPRPAVMIGMGGSIPVVGDFQRLLGMDSLLVGFGLADDRIHSPNEKYELRSFHKGIRSWIRILDALAR